MRAKTAIFSSTIALPAQAGGAALAQDAEQAEKTSAYATGGLPEVIAKVTAVVALKDVPRRSGAAQEAAR